MPPSAQRVRTDASRNLQPDPAPIEVAVVDDDADIRGFVALSLARDGMRVQEFGDARSAIAAVRERCPDVVVVDLRMPVMDGVALANALRGDPATAHVAIVAITGVIEPAWDVVRAFDAYLRKPLEPELLVKIVKSLASTTGSGGG
jgi:CheY-like chemotaxis protein